MTCGDLVKKDFQSISRNPCHLTHILHSEWFELPQLASCPPRFLLPSPPPADVLTSWFMKKTVWTLEAFSPKSRQTSSLSSPSRGDMDFLPRRLVSLPGSGFRPLVFSQGPGVLLVTFPLFVSPPAACQYHPGLPLATSLALSLPYPGKLLKGNANGLPQPLCSLGFQLSSAQF